jgi:hypothetical protein
MNKKFLVDLAERVGWTAAEAAISVAIVAMTPLQDWWVAPLTAGLSLVKGWIAKHVGDPSSAALLSKGGKS